MKEILRIVLQKLVLVSVGLVCIGTAVPFLLAIVESLVNDPRQHGSSILKTYVKKLVSGGLV
jgi:hypothetical protein